MSPDPESHDYDPRLHEELVVRVFPRTQREAFKPEVDTGMEHYPGNTLRTVTDGILWVLSVLALAFIIFSPQVWSWLAG